ncbi:hypothetical protein NESM_000364500 [Novymonas esmeraldas]|uniref:Uncharacterized protein n=1 Tax=Novymonas esmeraldas TaxID=1808958 RepID=A0AAW0EK90_9TRYP
MVLRHTRRLCEHVPLSATAGTPVYTPLRPGFWTRRLHRFRRRGALGRVATVVGYGVAGLGTYVATCLVIRTLHQPTVDALFAPARDYTLEEWRDVEPTLQPGDVLLMRGTGPMSWCITTLQFLLSFCTPAALRYSHVAVVVAPAVVEYVEREEAAAAAAAPPYCVSALRDVFCTDTAGDAGPAVPEAGRGGGSRSVRELLQAEEAALHRSPVTRRGAIVLEAMDNKDYDVPDVRGRVSHDAVQLVEASRRLLSMTPSGVPAYKYFAVRRLRHYDHTPERQSRLAQFCEDSEGRRMDSSLLYPLAFVWPRVHTRTHPLRQLVTGEVSCSELIVELYQHLGVVRRHWRWVPVEPATAAPATSSDVAATAAQVPPAPTAADVADDRRRHSLHVYDLAYGRVDAQTRQPLLSRDRPLLPDTEVVEGGELIAAAGVRRRSCTARAQPRWDHVEDMTITDMYGRAVSAMWAAEVRRRLRRPADATYYVDDTVPPLVLRAGDTTRGLDGRDYQLQWYYAHNSVATCPFHFTAGAGETVLDFAANTSLGPESYMRIARRGDALSRAMEDH